MLSHVPKKKAIRNTVAELTASDLNGKDEYLAAKVVEYVNRLMTKPDRGLKCDSFNVQSISMDKRILEANQKIFATRAQQEMLLQQKLAEHELATQSLRMRSEQQKQEHELALAAERGKLEIAVLQAEEEARHKLQLWNGYARVCLFCCLAQYLCIRYYKQVGFTSRDLLELERLRIVESSQTSSKVVYAPFEYWGAARMMHDAELRNEARPPATI